MDSQSLLNGMKDLFASLGAKTSDSSYAVPLVNSSTGEPKGFMSMANLASVLGEILFGELTTSMSSTLRDAPRGVWYVYSPGSFSDNPLGVDHCSILISARGKNSGHRGCILIDVESASDLVGIYVTYSGTAWKKLV